MDSDPACPRRRAAPPYPTAVARDASVSRRSDIKAVAPLGLPRSCRLQRGSDFLRLKNDGQRIVVGCLILNWMTAGSPPGSRLGVITSGRLGNAVVRSRARRLLREAFRHHHPSLVASADIVLIARASISKRDFAGVEQDLLEALRRARLVKRPERSAPPS